MFTRWGDLVYKLRFAVIGVVVAALLALGGYGLGLEDHLSSSGWDDPTSESSKAAHIADAAFGRDHNSDVILLYTAPDGKTIDDPEWSRKIVDNLNSLPKDYPDQIAKVNGAYWRTNTGASVPSTFGTKDKKYAFASVAIVGDNDTDMVRNFRKVKDVFYIPGVDVQVTGLQAVAGTLNDTIASDARRMEVIAIPAVAVLLFFIFGGIVAAAMPLIVGGLTVIGANGIVMLITRFTEVNSFVGNVVSMIGLGLAIDYGLFIVSRFREELAEGYDTRAAVRRSVMTAGRTVVFSATMIIASLGGMLLFPQGFLKSIAYGSIATVALAALTALTILPAMLSILGKRVDMLGLKRFRKTKTAEEVENGIWGKSTRWVMQHPLKIAIPLCIVLLLLIIPVKNLAFGGINERYLPPDDPVRVSLANFYKVFPLKKTDPIQLVMVSDNSNDVGQVWREAQQAPGLITAPGSAGPFGTPSPSTTDKTVYQTTATLVDSDNAGPTIEFLRSMDVPDDVQVYVGGQPAIQQDSINTLLHRMPGMIALVVLVTTLLMFLTFGSLVLPIKAALMSALGLGSTLGILTWIFVDGHGAGLLNFTPQPIMSPVLVLIMAVVYGLSVDYEVFLLSRMVEARTRGASTTEAVRAGTAHTGNIITAAALILLVVTGAFAFSKLVMMKYLAYGMVAALFIDATLLRMLLVPATMKLLGDDCWWAPKWMKKIQEKIGLGEPILDDELPGNAELVDLVKTTPVTDPVTTVMPALKTTRKTPHRPRTVEEIEAGAPTVHFPNLKNAVTKHDPTRPMPPQALGESGSADSGVQGSDGEFGSPGSGDFESDESGFPATEFLRLPSEFTQGGESGASGFDRGAESEQSSFNRGTGSGTTRGVSGQPEFNYGSESGAPGFDRGAEPGPAAFNRGLESGPGEFSRGAESGASAFNRGLESGPGEFSRGTEAGPAAFNRGAESGPAAFERGAELGASAFNRGSEPGPTEFNRGVESGSGEFSRGAESGPAEFSRGAESGPAEFNRGAEPGPVVFGHTESGPTEFNAWESPSDPDPAGSAPRVLPAGSSRPPVPPRTVAPAPIPPMPLGDSSGPRVMPPNPPAGEPVSRLDQPLTYSAEPPRPTSAPQPIDPAARVLPPNSAPREDISRGTYSAPGAERRVAPSPHPPVPRNTSAPQPLDSTSRVLPPNSPAVEPGTHLGRPQAYSAQNPDRLGSAPEPIDPSTRVLPPNPSAAEPNSRLGQPQAYSAQNQAYSALAPDSAPQPIDPSTRVLPPNPSAAEPNSHLGQPQAYSAQNQAYSEAGPDALGSAPQPSNPAARVLPPNSSGGTHFGQQAHSAQNQAYSAQNSDRPGSAPQPTGPGERVSPPNSAARDDISRGVPPQVRPGVDSSGRSSAPSDFGRNAAGDPGARVLPPNSGAPESDSRMRQPDPTARVLPPRTVTPPTDSTAPMGPPSQPTPAVDDTRQTPESTERPSHRAPTDPDNGPDTSRSSIENWMAELRSSRRRIGNRDEGRHHSGDGRTVSVNELLRRRENDE
ncbi:MMPL family transporter [Nocardia arthritidis]|uniref:MMPL family transporter n=1 Tax=Nocardia arthritidis TaxID=228602 RepID=A0A6G9YTW1_9NOCA|nr:MMPL family transporter [Nocardia arthritidis]